jgi:hypothetical protein
MPPRRRPRASTAKFSGEQWPEPQDPPSHRFVRDIQSSLGEQVFDVTIAERETQIEPNGVPDNRRRKLVAGKQDDHAPSYPPNVRALASRDKTAYAHIESRTNRAGLGQAGTEGVELG